MEGNQNQQNPQMQGVVPPIQEVVPPTPIQTPQQPMPPIPPVQPPVSPTPPTSQNIPPSSSGSKKLLVFILLAVIILLIAAGAFYYLNNLNSTQQNASDLNLTPTVCSKEPLQCPDGSKIYKTGAKCEFPICPTTILTPSASASPTLALNQKEASCSSKTTKATMKFAEAQSIAVSSCATSGASLLTTTTCNETTGTWWFDMKDSKKPLCNPACVVNLTTKKAEINWRCTGLLQPTKTATPSTAR